MDSPLPYHPLGGSEVLHQSGGLVLCNDCQIQKDSWPWWAQSGLAEDEGAVLVARYDASFHP